MNELDFDADGWIRSDGDLLCDLDDERNPGVPEICDNGIDDDCDGVADHCAISFAEADLLIEGVPATSSGRPGLGDGAATAIADLDGDGVADLLLGDTNTSEGYIVYGAASGVVGVAIGSVLHHPPGGGYFGWGVGAGDANGDGVGDALVGAPGEPAETVYLFLGPITGNRDALDADAFLLGRRSGLDGTTLPGTTNLIGPDLDGDGQADIVVGAEDYGETRGAPDDGAPTGGAVYVISGNVTGAVALETDATYRYTGVRSGNELGRSMQRVGDWNADGIDDLAVGSNAARVYLIDGGGVGGAFDVEDAASGWIRDPDGNAAGIALAAADYDGDGTSDLFAGAPGAHDDSGTRVGVVRGFLGPLRGFTVVADAETTWMGTGEGPYGSYLGTSIAVNDLDGDGGSDVAMADATGGPNANGAVYVQLGRANGTVVVADLLTLAGADASAVGNIASPTVGTVPDWTGDGAAELLIGAPTVEDASGAETGAVYVFFSDSLFP